MTTPVDLHIKLDLAARSKLESIAAARKIRLSQAVREAIDFYIKYLKVDENPFQHVVIDLSAFPDPEPHLNRILECYAPYLHLAVFHPDERALHLILKPGGIKHGVPIFLHDLEGFCRYLKSKPHTQLFP